jgi:YbbR domain-containing protein
MLKTEWYKNKNFWGAFLVAIAVWGYASLNDDYQANVDVPLTILPPFNRAVENALPASISVDITGKGWNLFNYMYLNNSKSCIIDLNEVNHNDSIYSVTNVDMQKGIEGINKLRVLHFYPDYLQLETGEIGTKNIAIESAANVSLDDGYVLVGEVRTDPPNVKITGNSQLIDKIKVWKTKSNDFPKINTSFSYRIGVSDSLSSVVNINPSEVTIYGTVQQYGELTIRDVELQVVGGTLSETDIVSPHYFDVTISGGIDLLTKITSADIDAYIEYDAVINDSTGVLVPKFNIPTYTTLISIAPQYIIHKKIDSYLSNLD